MKVLSKRFGLKGLLTLSLALMPVMSLAPQSAVAATATATARFSDKAQGFSFQPPEGWIAQEASDDAFVIYSDPQGEEFATNLNVNVSKDEDFEIEQLPPVLKKMFLDQFDEWNMAYDGYVTISGQKSYFMSSRFTMSGMEIQNLQFYIRGKKNRFYVMTFTALASEFKKFEAIFKKTAASVQTLS